MNGILKHYLACLIVIKIYLQTKIEEEDGSCTFYQKCI